MFGRPRPNHSACRRETVSPFVPPVGRGAREVPLRTGRGRPTCSFAGAGGAGGGRSGAVSAGTGAGDSCSLYPLSGSGKADVSTKPSFTPSTTALNRAVSTARKRVGLLGLPLEFRIENLRAKPTKKISYQFLEIWLFLLCEARKELS